MKVEDLPAIVKAQLLKVGMRQEGLYLTSFENIDAKWHVSAEFMLWANGMRSERTVDMVIDDKTGEVTKMSTHS